MRILKVEKSNCGWFVRYEYFDWYLLLVALLMESMWIYGVIMPFVDKFNRDGLWFNVLLWTTFAFCLLLAIIQPLALMIGTSRNDWFVTKEKFVKKIKIMVDNQYIS